MTRYRPFFLLLLLVAAVVLGLGSYFETSDDEHFALLFSGATAAAPQAVLAQYFHGLGHGLAAAYTLAPLVPWYGLLTGLLLLGATLLYFRVLHQLLRPHLRPGWLLGALGVFFLLGWLEHWQWFSHVRVAALLSLSGLLVLAAPGGRGRWLPGLAAVLLGCLIRPSAAGLGLLATLPAAAWLAARAGAGWRAAQPLGAALGVWLVVQAALSLTATPEAAEFRALDSRLALALDYQLTRPQPRTAADSLTVAAVDHWLFGADTLVNPAALDRLYRFDARHFLTHTLPAKLQLRLTLLARDYFPLLLALAVAAGFSLRLPPKQGRWYWLTQLYFGAALLLLAGVLKLPPRLALPLLDGWLLASLAALLEGRVFTTWPRGWRIGLSGGGVLVVGLYLAKIGHRTQVLRAEQEHHASRLEAARYHRWYDASFTANYFDHPLPLPPLVLGGADDLFKSLSPFRRYSLGPRPVLLLTGWPAHEAGPRRLLRQLSELPAQLPGLRRLAQGPFGATPRWLLSAEVAPVLARQLGGAPAFRPWQVVSEMGRSFDGGPVWYSVNPQPEH
ncbi:hypothetical protein Q5H93_02155 [Hymenobacter sp. ASUV-10]|uniref:Glycosyltransferase RgtA/B/C/D-like domain-containing protein n=1 Tax=Hymenobacter aranciens TaxID=3063996 RepID=A0ABT9B789_9BACT|nr:hypothetical protein [Hymenobacter sp. ASUV-10]MDO7873518.1 hypothetical protein [Hymenobacter sp. ASUV-10]